MLGAWNRSSTMVRWAGHRVRKPTMLSIAEEEEGASEAEGPTWAGASPVLTGVNSCCLCWTDM